MKKNNHRQVKKEVKTLSNLTSGVTKQDGSSKGYKSQDDTKIQIERSSSSSVDTHPDIIPIHPNIIHLLNLARTQGRNIERNNKIKYGSFEDFCMGEKQGRKHTIENEIKWLEDYLKQIRYARKHTAGLQIFQYPIQNRLDKLKSSLEEMGK